MARGGGAREEVLGKRGGAGRRALGTRCQGRRAGPRCVRQDQGRILDTWGRAGRILPLSIGVAVKIELETAGTRNYLDYQKKKSGENGANTEEI